MSKAQKIEKLLKWNRENNKTFEARAQGARLILTADTKGLNYMLHAVGEIQ